MEHIYYRNGKQRQGPVLFPVSRFAEAPDQYTMKI